MLLRSTSKKIEELIKLGKELLGSTQPEYSVGVAEMAKVSVSFNLKKRERFHRNPGSAGTDRY
jgi:hypothetical protein